MTFTRNKEREKILLNCWETGKTVKVASALSGIPEGSVSHYYRRFNRDKERYHRFEKKGQTPPTSSTENAAAATFLLLKYSKEAMNLFLSKKYGDARDCIEFILLFDEFITKYERIIQNREKDPKNEAEFLNLLAILSATDHRKESPTKKDDV